MSGVSIMAKKVAYGGDRSLMEKSLVGSKVKLYVGDDSCVKHEAVFIRRMDNRGHQTLVKKSVFFYPPSTVSSSGKHLQRGNQRIIYLRTK